VFGLGCGIVGPLLPSAIATVVHIDGTPSHPSTLGDASIGASYLQVESNNLQIVKEKLREA
jgi:hypothetical protein